MTGEPGLGALLVRALGQPDPGADPSDPEERILDAALIEIGARGVRGTTIDRVAARAELARMTVFRRFGSKEALVERLMLRELRRFLTEVDRAITPVADPGERVALSFVLCVRAARRHPLVARIARREPGWALEHLAAGDPAPLELARRFVAARLEVEEGTDEVADILVRLALTYVFLPGPVVDVGDDAAAHEFARRMLSPLVGARRPAPARPAGAGRGAIP